MTVLAPGALPGTRGSRAPTRDARPFDDDERTRRSDELFRQRDLTTSAGDGGAAYHAAVDSLVALHLPLARAASNRYQTSRDDHEDVFQVACLGLVKAVKRFDPGVGAPFGAFAMPTITGEVRRYFRDHAWDIRPPRWIQELRPDVDRAVERITQETGRPPTVDDVAAHLGVSAGEVLETMEASTTCLNLHSIDLPHDADGSRTVQDTIGDEDHEIEIAPDRVSLRPLLAALDERDRKILVLRFVRGCTQRQIAEQVGLSQTQVCRLLERVLVKLRDQLRDEDLAA